MKKIGIQMNIFMGLFMSIILSIVGTTFGQATSAAGIQFPGIIIGIVVSFIASFAISLIIGFIVPMKKVGDGVCNLFKTSSNAILGKVVSALASDLIYTPVITFAMVAIARFMAGKQNPEALAHMPPYIIMVLPSLALTLVVGWVVIFIIQPILMKRILKKNGIEV